MYSVMMDETTYTSNLEQVTISVRFIFEGPIEEWFLDITAIADNTGEALARHLIARMESDSLSLNQALSQSYDGAGNMSGQYRGVQARVWEQYPHVTYVYCYAHNLNHLLVNICSQVPVARDFFALVEELYVIIEGSSKRHFFISAQKRHRPNETPRQLAGLSDSPGIVKQ
ncbi:Zinc finger MYM-type protein 1 [Holothuria leucospilota]|uniref:Zinc finger MYM-type protein 1 n=1 Tax=Holothuria leucospilota TaxID=206669 RepID=A0A9Q0YKS8_HOLLE|nr:Zinc finger MYM-type protein 1 [Holothuria leucospilota]